MIGLGNGSGGKGGTSSKPDDMSSVSTFLSCLLRSQEFISIYARGKQRVKKSRNETLLSVEICFFLVSRIFTVPGGDGAHL